MLLFRAVIHLLIQHRVDIYIAYQGMIGSQLKNFLSMQRYFVNGRKTVLHTTSSFFATIPLKNNHMGGFHDHDRQNT